MTRDEERIRSIQSSLEANHWDALLCSLPMNVLLLTGYWPVVGTSVAILFRGGPIRVIVPEDEEDLARKGWADEVVNFRPGYLEKIITPREALREPLQSVMKALSGRKCRHRSRAGRGYRAGFLRRHSSLRASDTAVARRAASIGCFENPPMMFWRNCAV